MSENNKKLQNLLKKVNKNRDNPIVQLASDTVDKFGFYNTPLPVVNKLIGGVPIGRFTIIAGSSQTGKSALSLQTIAHLQREDPEFIAAWVDFENAWDPNWAETLGVDLGRTVLLSYGEGTESMESVLDRLMDLLSTKMIGLVVIDSIGGMAPKGDLEDKKGERSLEQPNMLNLQTKLGEVFRKFNIKIAPRGSFKGTAVIMLGHVYQVPNSQGYTIHEVRGGNAVKHWGHIRLSMKRGPKADWPKQVESVSLDGTKRLVYPGFSSRIQLEKTKNNANEGQEVAVTFFHGRGFDCHQSTISAAMGLGIIERSGGWYKSDLIPGGKVQGRDALDEYFTQNESVYSKLTKRVDEHSLAIVGEEDESQYNEH